MVPLCTERRQVNKLLATANTHPDSVLFPVVAQAVAVGVRTLPGSQSQACKRDGQRRGSRCGNQYVERLYPGRRWVELDRKAAAGVCPKRRPATSRIALEVGRVIQIDERNGDG